MVLKETVGSEERMDNPVLRDPPAQQVPLVRLDRQVLEAAMVKLEMLEVQVNLDLLDQEETLAHKVLLAHVEAQEPEEILVLRGLLAHKVKPGSQVQLDPQDQQVCVEIPGVQALRVQEGSQAYLVQQAQLEEPVRLVKEETREVKGQQEIQVHQEVQASEEIQVPPVPLVRLALRDHQGLLDRVVHLEQGEIQVHRGHLGLQDLQDPLDLQDQRAMQGPAVTKDQVERLEAREHLDQEAVPEDKEQLGQLGQKDHQVI